MALIDLESRSIVAKIVYFGPARSGKTTNLRALYQALPEAQRGPLAEFDSEGEPTVFFDYVPLELGDGSGFDITLRLYTVSGQEGRHDARMAVLTGADGVVFVADASQGRERENAQSMQELRDALSALHPGEGDAVPVVVQFNKLDVADRAVPGELIAAIAGDGVPAMYASALERRGVVETLEAIAREVVRRV
ncbi:MAG: GTPase domain-containing protein [Thermomicrobiales bacterium]|nr:GTPase domain-containing protein [Thermomicrobiales bacterium]